MKIILIGARPRSLINFRGPLLKTLSDSGYETIAMASKNDPAISSQLKKINVNLIPYPIKRNGMNPLSDFFTWIFLRKVFKQVKPDIILSYTIKPVIWGGLASRCLPGVRFYALITGLGFAFQGGNFKRDLISKIAITLYRISLKNADKVIFQNPDNLDEFVSRSIVPREKCKLVNGSGVDLDYFTYSPVTDITNRSIVFLCLARLLKEKGLREYAAAAKIVQKKYPEATFNLLGIEDTSPDGLPMSEVKKWHNDGNVNYLGYTDDVRPYIKKCDIYVLPSYHEGMPRTTLEAMAIGRPILTTNVPGCNKTVEQGVNGYLVGKGEVNSLAEKMIWFIENQDHRIDMGQKSRQIAEDKFDVHKINKHLMHIMQL